MYLQNIIIPCRRRWRMKCFKYSYFHCTKKFPIKNFLSLFPTDLVRFTEVILNGKLFCVQCLYCSVCIENILGSFCRPCNSCEIPRIDSKPWHCTWSTKKLTFYLQNFTQGNVRAFTKLNNLPTNVNLIVPRFTNSLTSSDALEKTCHIRF